MFTQVNSTISSPALMKDQHVRDEIDELALSQWPTPTPRLGHEPGTKITEERPVR